MAEISMHCLHEINKWDADKIYLYVSFPELQSRFKCNLVTDAYTDYLMT